MVKETSKSPGLNFMVGGMVVNKQPAPPAAPGGRGQLQKGRPKPPQKKPSATQTTRDTLNKTRPGTAPRDTLDKTPPGTAPKGGPSPKSSVPAGVTAPAPAGTTKQLPRIQRDPAADTVIENLPAPLHDGFLPRIEIDRALDTVIEDLSPPLPDALLPDALPPVASAHRTRYRQLSARNARTGSKDAQLQTRLINEKAAEQYGDKWFDQPIPAPPALVLKPGLNNHFRNPESIETLLLDELQTAWVDTPLSRTRSGHLIDPTNVFVQPHEGASAITRIMGNFVLKGYNTQEDAEIEWAGTKLMQITGEISPDIHLASLGLRENIMAVEPGYKQLNITKNYRNPRMLEVGQPMHLVETIPVNDPRHCLVMPRVFGSNLANILEDPSLRTSLQENMTAHIRELSRIAFKDLLIGNSDRVVRMSAEDNHPPYIRTQEALQFTGSPMNSGNIMFQTADGVVFPHTAIAIDNFGHSKNHLTTEEGQKKELTAFQFYLDDIQSTSTQSTAEVLKGDHIISFIAHALKLEFNSEAGLQKDPVLTLSDEALLATIREGVLMGWSQVSDNVDSLQHFLKTPIDKEPTPEKHTLAYMDTISKKLDILKGTPIPTL